MLQYSQPPSHLVALKRTDALMNSCLGDGVSLACFVDSLFTFVWTCPLRICISCISAFFAAVCRGLRERLPSLTHNNTGIPVPHLSVTVLPSLCPSGCSRLNLSKIFLWHSSLKRILQHVLLCSSLVSSVFHFSDSAPLWMSVHYLSVDGFLGKTENIRYALM